MKTIRILNNYAGLGGNRKLWHLLYPKTKVTAVEINPAIANIYSDLYPQDEIIIGDAHEYLLNNYMNFDYIWSSLVCVTHSRIRRLNVHSGIVKPDYPDMSLYQQILFLQHNAKCYWTIENVIPYYSPLIPSTKQLGRHLFWANFPIPSLEFNGDLGLDFNSSVRRGNNKSRSSKNGLDLSKYKITNKTQILRNCVDYQVGKHIFNEVVKIFMNDDEQEEYE